LILESRDWRFRSIRDSGAAWRSPSHNLVLMAVFNRQNKGKSIDSESSSGNPYASPQHTHLKTFCDD